MNQQDPLAQLRDIHLPDMPGFWPPAPGWWVLAALVLAAIVGGLWAWRRQLRQQAYRRESGRALARAWAEFKADGERERYAQSLSQILRRTALTAYPQYGIATLTGQRWLEFLDATSPESIKGGFLSPQGTVLADLAYRPVDPHLDLAPLHALGSAWVEGHLKKVNPNHLTEVRHAAV